MNVGRTSSAQILTTVFLVFGAFQPVRGDDISEPDSRSQSRTSHESAGKQTEAKVIEQPPAKTTEPWIIKVGVPGWLINVSGKTGFHGVNPYVSVGTGQLLKHTNVILLFGGDAEVRKGRFGALGDLLYYDAQAGVSGEGLVARTGLGLQLFIGELFGSYRLIEGPHGWLDLLAGFKSTYIGQQVSLQANNMAIDVASTRLVDDFAQQLTTPNSDLRMLIDQHIVNGLTSLEGRHPPLPVGPLFGDQPDKIAALVQALIESQHAELAAAIRAGVQAKVNQLKAQLASKVANILTGQLNRSLSFYDNWIDPVIGVRGRLNLSKAFYLTAETDVGGFGIGSDIAWQGYAALGCQITRNIYSEVGYRALYDDFRDESDHNFLYQLWFQGAQITTGLKF
jgi:hypothetical protein